MFGNFLFPFGEDKGETDGDVGEGVEVIESIGFKEIGSGDGGLVGVGEDEKELLGVGGPEKFGVIKRVLRGGGGNLTGLALEAEGVVTSIKNVDAVFVGSIGRGNDVSDFLTIW